MKTRTPKKEGSTPPVKKVGDKTPSKTGTSPAQSKASALESAPALKIEEEVKAEMVVGDTEPKSVKAASDGAEASREVKAEVTAAATSPVKVNGDAVNEESVSGSVKTSHEPGLGVAKPKMKVVTRKKKKIPAVPSQAKSTTSEPSQPVNETNAGEKPGKSKPSQMVTKAAVSKQKGLQKGISKPTIKGKGTAKVKKILKEDKLDNKETGNEPSSKVVTFEEQPDVKVVETAGGKDTAEDDDVVGEDDEVIELVNEDDEIELEEDGDEYVEEGLEADELEPRPATERQKRKKLEVFVGGLDKDAKEEDLKSVFQRVGDVVEVRLVMNPLTGKNKGYAFIRFGTAEQATRAITELARTQVRGKDCGVLPNQDNDTLFLGNISRDWKRPQVLEKLKGYGIDGIEELTLMEDPTNERLNRGFAFLELATHSDALKAFQRLQLPDAVFGSDRSAKVAWAQPLNDPDDAVMSQVKSVFVDGMPASWSDDKVKQHFGKFGEIERIVFARNMPVAKRKDFAFINFVVRESALACVSAMEGVDLIDGDNKVKMKVTLARPLPKGRFGKAGARGGFLLGQGGRGMGRGEGWFYSPRFNFRRPFRGGRGFSWGAGRAMGRYGGKRPFHEEDIPPFPRAPRHQDDWNFNSRGRRLSGGYPRMSRGYMRGAYSRNDDNRYYEPRQSDFRRDEPRRNDLGYGRGAYQRPGLDHGASRGRFSQPGPPPKVEHGPPHRPLRGVSSARSRATHPGRRLSPRHENVHSHQYEGSHMYGHERDVFDSRAQDYDESGLGMKQQFSAWEDDPSYYDTGHRGYPRARVDYSDPSSLPDDSSRYLDSVRQPPGRPNQVLGLRPERSGPSAVGDGPVSGFYDSGGLGTAGNNSLHGTHSYGSMLPETNDYMSAPPEMRGTSLHPSSLYGEHSGSGVYDFQGPGYY